MVIMVIMVMVAKVVVVMVVDVVAPGRLPQWYWLVPLLWLGPQVAAFVAVVVMVVAPDW